MLQKIKNIPLVIALLLFITNIPLDFYVARYSAIASHKPMLLYIGLIIKLVLFIGLSYEAYKGGNWARYAIVFISGVLFILTLVLMVISFTTGTVTLLSGIRLFINLSCCTILFTNKSIKEYYAVGSTKKAA